MKTKICCTCKEEKPLDAFGKLKSNKDGLAIRCKFCANKAGRQFKADRKKGLTKERFVPIKINGFKQCSVCRKILKITNFGSHKGTKDKLNHRCIICNRIKQIEYWNSYKKSNPIKLKHKTKIKNAKMYVKHKNIRAIRQKNKIKKLPDNYVIGCICWDTPNLKKHIPPELIELKRVQIKINRYLKELAK